MTETTITVNSTWTTLFNTPLYGYFGIYLKENAENLCAGSIQFMENGNVSSSETTISMTRGINIITYLNRVLPMSFHFENHPSRVYELRKNGNYLEARITSGTDISITFTLFSGYPDKSIVLLPRTNNSANASYIRLGTFEFPIMKNAKAKSVSWMTSNATSYNIRLLDKSNNTILLDVNLSNTTEQINDLGSLSNLPSTPTQVEISVKRNGGNSQTQIYLESITINYN